MGYSHFPNRPRPHPPPAHAGGYVTPTISYGYVAPAPSAPAPSSGAAWIAGGAALIVLLCLAGVICPDDQDRPSVTPPTPEPEPAPVPLGGSLAFLASALAAAWAVGQFRDTRGTAWVGHDPD